jgi:dolichol-phosphate mannosyltransferase
VATERADPGAERWPVTIIIPTRNEAGNVAPLLRRLPLVDQVLFVDDSDDDTPAAVRAAAGASPSPVRVLHRPRGRRAGGLSGAVTLGLAEVASPWVCVMDGDLQHPPEVVGRLMERAADDDVDLVIASRRNWESINEGLGPVRRVVSWTFGRAALALFGPSLRGVTDPLSGFFAVRTKALDVGLLRATGFKILLEVLVTHPELRRAEVGFAFARRGSGQSNGSVVEALRYLRHLARLRRRLRAVAPGVHRQPVQGT